MGVTDFDDVVKLNRRCEGCKFPMLHQVYYRREERRTDQLFVKDQVNIFEISFKKVIKYKFFNFFHGDLRIFNRNKAELREVS